MNQLQSVILATALLLGTVVTVQAQDKASLESPLTPEKQREWCKILADYNYTEIARAYADFMIEHGRDVYGKPSPLFVTGIVRHTGNMSSPPFPHVKRKPFMPGYERDRECRPSDRNYGQADPLDQLALLQLMHRLTKITGDEHYAQEADKTAAWWMENTQTGIGLYPWGTHTYWNVAKDGGGGTFEFNRPWPYWELNPPALQKYAMGLWDHYVADKKTGNFNRHANSNQHGPSGGMEFPWPGSAMIATWVEAYLANPDPEYVRAIDTILNRWESLRDTNGHLAPCSSYGEWAWYEGYMYAANILDDCAEVIEEKELELAEKMREYGRKNDAAYLKLADNLLDIKRVGPVKSYLRATGGYNPDRLDILGGPWQDRKHYAGFALLLHDRTKRNDSEALRKRYYRAVLDTAEVYMSINPEVQWSVWGANMSDAIELMFTAYDLTGNVAYLHRAEQFGRLAVDLFLDDVSPLPKITSHDDFYEIERVTGDSTDAWMLAVLDLRERLARADEASRYPARIETAGGADALPDATVIGAPADAWREALDKALAEKRAGVWDCTKLSKPAASVALNYGEGGERTLFLSRREGSFASSRGLPVDELDLIASDFINKIPTLAEVELFNGPYRRKFSGKHREVSTASYGGFKDVMDKAGLLMVNHGKRPAKVTVTVTYHDSWDDRETVDHAHALGPGERVVVACAAPAKRFIRRLHFGSDVADAVKLERFAFVMTPRSKMNPLTPEVEKAEAKVSAGEALVFLIAGQSNAGGVAAFSPESNEKSGMAKKHPTIPGSTAKEVGIPTTKDAYPRCYIWKPGNSGPFERLTPGQNLRGGYRDPNRHGIELPMAMLLEKQYPRLEKFLIKHGPGGHNLYSQWAAGRGPDYVAFMSDYRAAMRDLQKRYDQVQVIGLYWDQGESDRPQAEEYGKNLRALFAAFRKDTEIPDLPIFVRKHLFQHRDESFVPILNAQIEVTTEDRNAHLLDLDHGSNEKNFKAWAWTDKNGHLSSKAYLELAKRLLARATTAEGIDAGRKARRVGIKP
ncbi:MAG: hypothetical protein H8E44_19550 [Planctomycetes bacterium]|nr:hypothetical protein [Planctomycetota bacterium]MBL7037036.1 hypothetical protein [Pirellulaceae bacterium]